MKNRIIVIIIMASFLVTVMILLELNNLEKGEKKSNQLVNVLVARHDIPAFTLISTNDISVIKVPKRYQQAHSYNNKHSLFTNNQSKFYTKIRIFSNTQITKSIVENVDQAPFHVLIPEGMRAVDVPIVDQDFLDLLLPGTKIDFILRLYDTTLFLFQNIVIIKKGNLIMNQMDRLKKAKNFKPRYRTITVLFSPNDVLRYFYMINNLSLDIIARSKLDDKIIEGVIIKRDNFVSGNYESRKGIKELTDLTENEKLDILKDFTKSQKNAFIKENIGVLRDKALKARNDHRKK